MASSARWGSSIDMKTSRTCSIEHLRSRTVSPLRSPPGSGPGNRGTNRGWPIRGRPPIAIIRLQTCAMWNISSITTL